MRDLDELLAGDVADAAAESVGTTPDLAALRTRGTRRRQLRRTALAGVAVAAVVAVAFQVPGSVRPEPAEPAPPPTATPSPTSKADKPQSALTPDQIVDHPRSRVDFVAVSPVDPEIRAVIWARGQRRAVAVTADGFETRHTVRLNAFSLTPLGTRGFLIEDWAKAPRLLSPDGKLARIDVDSIQRPAKPGEVVVGIPGSGVPWVGWVAVDPETAQGHQIPVPEGVDRLVQDPGGRLQVLTMVGANQRRAYRWSDDGGNTWESWSLNGVDLRPNTAFELVRSADPSQLVIIESGDGATGAPFVAAQTLDPQSGNGSAIAGPGRRAYFRDQVVLPDGSLFAHFDSWSDDEEGRPSPRSHAFYVGSETNRMEAVPMGAPFGERENLPTVVGMDVQLDVVTIYARGDDAKLFRTTDSGVTWEEVQTR